MIYIVDDIGKVVQSLRTGSFDVYEEGTADAPFYMYGHRQEIANRLSDLDQRPQSKKNKYPLIALKLDISETTRGDVSDFNLNIVIATSTKLNYNAEERMLNVFKPILYPLYDRFLTAFQESGFFMWDSQLDQKIVPHMKIDRPFWGTPSEEKNLKNIFNDPIDAIELVNMKFSRMDLNN